MNISAVPIRTGVYFSLVEVVMVPSRCDGGLSKRGKCTGYAQIRKVSIKAEPVMYP